MSTKTLEHLRELARRAHYWTSFTPEKRAESIVNIYSEELDDDMIEITKLSAEYAPRYKEKYIQFLSHWLRSKSNCASSMIAGPANFNVRRAEKANRSEENRYNEFRQWRDKIFASFQKQAKRQAIIDAGGELEIAKQKLIDLQFLQEYMKRINKAHAAYIKNPNSILESELSESEKDFVIKWVPLASYHKKPFMSFSLTNNNAKIKAAEARVKVLEDKEAAKSDENTEFEIPGGKLILNYQADRIQIFNEQKPEQSVIASYKSHGLKWSPFNKCWQRQITPNAKFSMKRLFNINLQ